MEKTRVLVAMSGGVDSSVAATLLLKRGYSVTGVHMALKSDEQQKSSIGDKVQQTGQNKGCCNIEDVVDARISASRIGITFYVWNLAEQFYKEVIRHFIEGYKNGKTPNPCIKCNEEIKFKLFLRRAKSVGFDKISTGHYARIVEGASGYELHRAVDIKKDQSYVLSHLVQDEIRHLYFPLGDLHKDEVREIAGKHKLNHISDKRDSMGICFLGGRSVKEFMKSHITEKTGYIVYAPTGQIVGTHDGVYGYTVGQRRGLGIDHTLGSLSQPLYVKAIDGANNRLIVDTADAMLISSVAIENVTWTNAPLVPEDKCTVQVSAHGYAYSANIASIDKNMVVFQLNEKIVKVAYGQRLAIYDGTRVVGGGTVCNQKER